MANHEYHALKSALLWHLEAGADALLGEVPGQMIRPADNLPVAEKESVKYDDAAPPPPVQFSPLGAAEARTESLKLAQAAQTLDALKQAIAEFDGIALKGTATNLVF